VIKIYQMIRQYIMKAEGRIEIDIPKGAMVYEYKGPTYGCCTPDEQPVSIKPHETPFFGVPKGDLLEIGTYTGGKL
jgi:hypothetical protein